MLIKPIGIAVEMFVQTKVDQVAWGKYAALYSLCHLCVTFADLGLNQYLTKEIASSEHDKAELTGSILSFKLIAFFLFPLLMLPLGLLLGYEIKWLWLLFIVALVHGLIQLFGFFRAQIQGNQLFKLDSLTSNIDKTLLIILTFGVIFTQLNVINFAYSRVLAIALSCVILFILSKRHGLLVKPNLKLKGSAAILRGGLPFAFITLVYSINEKIDQVMVERLSQNLKIFDQSYVYSAAYRLVDAVMMYLWIVLPMFFAKFSHHQTDSELSKKLLKTGTSIVFLPVAFIAIFSIFHSDLLFIYFKNSSPNGYQSMSKVFSILCLTLLFQGMFAILSTFLTSTGHEKYVTKLVLISVCFNVICNFYFIPKYGAYAAAWTTFGSTVIVVFGYIYKIVTSKLVNLPYILWLKLSCITLFTGLANYFGLYYSQKISIGLGIIIFILSMVILKPIGLKDIKNIT